MTDSHSYWFRFCQWLLERKKKKWRLEVSPTGMKRWYHPKTGRLMCMKGEFIIRDPSELAHVGQLVESEDLKSS